MLYALVACLTLYALRTYFLKLFEFVCLFVARRCNGAKACVFSPYNQYLTRKSDPRSPFLSPLNLSEFSWNTIHEFLRVLLVNSRKKSLISTESERPTEGEFVVQLQIRPKNTFFPEKEILENLTGEARLKIK